MPMFGRKAPKASTHDHDETDYHWEWVMNADGTRSTTRMACRCPAGTAHDGPVPEPED